MTTPLAAASAIRAGDFASRVYSSFYAPPPIATGTLIGITPPAPRIVIGVNYVTGAYTDVQQGMEICFYDAATSAFKGRSHIIYSTIPITGVTLPIREFALSTLDIGAGDLFAVFPDYRVHDKLVAATEQFQPDYLDYTDLNLHPPPVAFDGGHWAGDISQLPVQCNGDLSYAVDPANVSGVTHARTLPTGLTFASGISTDPTPTITGDPGQYVYDHTVTDADSGKATTEHVIVIITDAAHPPHHGNISNYGAPNVQAGFGWTFEVTQGATDLATIPDGCTCILWTDETVAGVQASYRNLTPGRSTILGVGMTRRDTSGWDAPRHTIQFEVISPIARLKEITSYSKEMIEAVSPAAWDQVNTLGVKRGILQVFLFYTTLVEAGYGPTFDPDFLDYRYPGLALQRADFLSQIGVLVRGQDAVITCDRSGRIDIHTALQYVPLADRAAISKSWDFQPSDILGYEFTREHVNTVQWFKANGFAGGTANNAPVYSQYPSGSPGEGTGTPTQALLILDPADPQGDINDRTARYGAEADNTYIDADGIQWRAFPLKLKLRGVYNFFDFSKQYADFSDSILNKRGVDLTGLLFYLVSISVTYAPNGTAETNAVFNVATYAPGNAEMTYIPPSPDQTNLPSSTTPPQPPITPAPSIPGLVKGSGRIIMLNTDGNAYPTTNFQTSAAQGGPSWATLTPGVTGTPMDWVQDPYMLSRYVIVTDGSTDAIATYDDPLGSGTLTARASLHAGAVTRLIEADFGAGYIWVVSYYGSTSGHTGTWYTYSSDHGDTWSAEAQITAFYDTATAALPGLYASTHEAGVAFTSAQTATGALSATAFFKLTAGSSPVQITSPSGFDPGFLGAFTLHLPFPASPEDQTAYFGRYTSGSPPNGRVYRRVGSTVTDISPILGGKPCRPNLNRSLHVCPIDLNSVVASVDDDSSTEAVFVSRDQGDHWTQIDGPHTPYYFVEIAGNDHSVIYLCGLNGAVGYSSDFATIDDRQGNLVTSGRNLRMFGLA